MTRLRRPYVAGETADGYRWWVLAVTSVGALFTSLTSGTLVIALPDILRDLHTDLFALMWIVIGCTLVATVLVLNAGRVADMFGRARTYTLGFVIFTLASIFCAVAADATQLIGGRVVQGIGGAAQIGGEGINLGPFMSALHVAFAAGVVASAIGAVVSMMRGGHRSWDERTAKLGKHAGAA